MVLDTEELPSMVETISASTVFVASTANGRIKLFPGNTKVYQVHLVANEVDHPEE
jgi:hypothetical protein